MSNERQAEQVRSGKGFVAALDQSGGSTPKALRRDLGSGLKAPGQARGGGLCLEGRHARQVFAFHPFKEGPAGG